MAARLLTILPRFAIVTFVFLFATAAVTFAAGKQIATAPATPKQATAAAPPALVVPDVRRQAFVFAKGSLEDAGFAWRVTGSVHGFAANTVSGQSPAPGVRVVDTGAPLITVTLVRNTRYPEHGAPEDASLLRGTAIELADIVAPAAPAKPTKPTVKKAKPAAPLAAPKVAKAKPAKKPSAKPASASRPPAFAVPGGRAEPLDEMPLTQRALLLRRFVETHREPTSANVKHWLYQHNWVVAGARLGWWHGAEALRTLLKADAKVQATWGIGGRSAQDAQRALAEVEARSR
jgi:hypothetical protein